MIYSDFIEKEMHGTQEFPIEFYQLDKNHHRYEMNLHWHPEAELIRVRRGRFVLHLNKQCYTLCEGDAAFINPGTLHRGIPEDCVYDCAVFKTEMLCPPGASVGKYIKPIAVQNAAVCECFRETGSIGERATVAAIDRLFSVLRERPAQYELAVYAALYSLFFALYEHGAVEKASLSHAHERQTAQLTRLLSWIDENYTSHITLSALSKVSGFNEKYLCRFFKEQTSYTPIDYINRLRVEKAADDMLNHRLSVTEAAFANGFNDSAYFSKVFRKIKGISPTAFKRSNAL
ncbi:MAG: helix-turn-helix domain-containing protein [Ruminococcaceae bacterium]|nr:helix-turn-helix domain-containing protein [Oscillospiraceae bacterium]